jgi:hypothetical protein
MYFAGKNMNISMKNINNHTQYKPLFLKQQYSETQ